jgi:hypothetical protein
MLVSRLNRLGRHSFATVIADEISVADCEFEVIAHIKMFTIQT